MTHSAEEAVAHFRTELERAETPYDELKSMIAAKSTPEEKRTAAQRLISEIEDNRTSDLPDYPIHHEIEEEEREETFKRTGEA